MGNVLSKFRDSQRPKEKRPSNTLSAYLEQALQGYWDRQGRMANEGLQMADQGAQAVQAGNMGGLAGMLLGPAAYIGSPVSALFPERSEVEAATDVPEWSKPLIAGGLETMAIMAPGPKTRGLNNIRMPSRDALNSASGATFQGRVLEQPTTMSIDALTGGVRTTDPTEVKRVSDLAAQISGPQGYFERIMVDTSGNVIEGQHRLEALRKLGISDVPVVVLRGADEGLDTAPMLAAAKGAGVHPEQAQQIVDSIGEIIAKGDSPLDYDPPRGFEAAWNAAVKAYASRDRGFGKGMAPGPKGKGLGRGLEQLTDAATDAERAALAGRLEGEAAQAAQAPAQFETGYHGTATMFDRFEARHNDLPILAPGNASTNGAPITVKQPAVYFTSSKDEALGFANTAEGDSPRVIERQIPINDLLTVDLKGDHHMMHQGPAFLEAQRQGKKGVRFLNAVDTATNSKRPATIYAVFDPEMVNKSGGQASAVTRDQALRNLTEAPTDPWLKPTPMDNYREAASLRMKIEPLETQLKAALQSKNATKATTLREKLKAIRDRVAQLSPGGPLLSAERVDEILKAHPNADLSAEDIAKMFPEE